MQEIYLLESIDIGIEDEGGVAVVGDPIGTEECARERAMQIVRDGGADHLGRYLANIIPEKQAAAIITVEYLGQRTSYLERGLNPGLSLEAYRRANNGAQWAHELTLELPEAVESPPLLQKGCPDNQPTLKPYQQAQGLLSTGVRGLGLPSTEVRRISGLSGHRVEILPEVLADLTGPLGNRVRSWLPESSVVAQSRGSLREIQDVRGG